MHLLATLPWPHLAGEGRLWLEGRAVNGKLAGLLSWLPWTHNEVSLTKIPNAGFHLTSWVTSRWLLPLLLNTLRV